ncbi:hypothetical protein H2198_007838 [Neophaeococcomyces mojaviensis]|uniref:Uncharacterized protein n=1 Tax=Neophaeococcomyces mojaviensis TaxID=3383035 RepID=A0ACC2ZZ75_9EURO|nr:hypothetical protein H2198_007838 [Knufia sp. JES_112]
MAVSSHHNGSTNSASRGSKCERPVLYVLATRPSTPDQSSTSEWTLELYKPAATGPKPLSTVSHPAHAKHHFFSALSRKQKQPSSEMPVPAVSAASESKPVEDPQPQHFYFSRLHPHSYSQQCPNDTILRIAVSSIPYQNSHKLPTDLEQQFSAALDQIHTTPDSTSWLRQSLLSLQTASILHPVSHGFDVDKFVSFALSYLEQTLREQPSYDAEPREVNYSKILRDNERLRGMLSSDTTDYATIDTSLGVDEEGDEWSLPSRERKAVAEKKHWGGFWVTHGSGADWSRSSSRQRDSDRKPWERSNVYGGLM